MTLDEIERELKDCDQAIACWRELIDRKERRKEELYRLRRALLMRPVA